MKTELEILKVSLLLAERAAAHPDLYTASAVLCEVQSAKEAFEQLENRYNTLQKQEPPEWQNIQYHLVVPADAPFDSILARMFAEGIRHLPWPPGIIVRFLAAEYRPPGHQHEFVVHHESKYVGVGMEVING